MVVFSALNAVRSAMSSYALPVAKATDPWAAANWDRLL
jgi:hypothetical protein